VSVALAGGWAKGGGGCYCYMYYAYTINPICILGYCFSLSVSVCGFVMIVFD